MFLIPFEHVLDIFFGVDTVLKPYRVMSILIIMAYALKLTQNGGGKANFLDDLALYLIFLYGIIVSLVHMATGSFSMRMFNNDMFQISLYLFTYFIIKNIYLNRDKWYRLFWCLTIGIIGNSYYIFVDFFFNGNYKRAEGFMSNSNYVALSIVVAIAFILYRLSVTQKWWKQLLFAGLVLFLLFVFPVTGSRSGLAILVVLLLLFFIFASFKAKFRIVIVSVLLGIGILSQNLEKINVGASFVLTNRVAKKINVEDVRVPIWRGAIRAADGVHYMGLGIGQFKYNFPSFFQREYHKTILEFVNRGAYMSAHSDFVTLLVVYGFVGLILYLYFLFHISRRILFRVELARDLEDKRFFQFNLMMIVALVIFGIGSENFLSPLYWAILGLATTSLFMTDQSDSEESTVSEVNT